MNLMIIFVVTDDIDILVIFQNDDVAWLGHLILSQRVNVFNCQPTPLELQQKFYNLL